MGTLAHNLLIRPPRASADGRGEAGRTKKHNHKTRGCNFKNLSEGKYFKTCLRHLNTDYTGNWKKFETFLAGNSLTRFLASNLGRVFLAGLRSLTAYSEQPQTAEKYVPLATDPSPGLRPPSPHGRGAGGDGELGPWHEFDRTVNATKKP
ncbi:MAG: hypothetical protein DMG05_16015 [Acidobacteria bacterium]|nr:MAG: hypothetical protein DMG05_16015 [Acidobacteriota bacterium]